MLFKYNYEQGKSEYPELDSLNKHWFREARKGDKQHPTTKAEMRQEVSKFVAWVKSRPDAYFPVPVKLSERLCKKNCKLVGAPTTNATNAEVVLATPQPRRKRKSLCSTSRLPQRPKAKKPALGPTRALRFYDDPNLHTLVDDSGEDSESVEDGHDDSDSEDEDNGPGLVYDSADDSDWEPAHGSDSDWESEDSMAGLVYDSADDSDSVDDGDSDDCNELQRDVLNASQSSTATFFPANVNASQSSTDTSFPEKMNASQSSSATSFSDSQEKERIVNQWTNDTVEEWRHRPEPHRSEALRNLMNTLKVRDGKVHNISHAHVYTHSQTHYTT